MRRPASASKTLGCSPLLKASWAHAARVEAVPIEATGAEPFAFRGDQPQTGQRMRGPDESPLLSRAGSRSIMVVVSESANDIILRFVHACETEILILLSASLAIKRTPPTGARISQRVVGRVLSTAGEGRIWN